MSRREDREGKPRWLRQYMINRQEEREGVRLSSGHFQRRTVAYRFERLAQAAAWTRRLRILLNLVSTVERQEHIRGARYALSDARLCFKPRLP